MKHFTILTCAITLCGAAEPLPHPGEPALHRELNPTASSNSARIYAREHLEGPPRVEPIYSQPKAVDHWEILLPKLHPAGADAILTLSVRDGSVVNGYTLVPSVDNFFHYTSTYRLELAGDHLSGSVRIRFLDKTKQNSCEYLSVGEERVAIFDLRVAAGKLSGTGKLLGGDSARQENLSGTVFVGGRPSRPEDAIASGALWPGHRGPFGSGGALDQKNRLVDDLSQARPVWKVAEDLPDGRAYSSGAGSMAPILKDERCIDWLRHSGAKSAPIEADGCVYFYTLIPSGDVLVETGVPKYSLAEFDKAAIRQAAHDWMPPNAKGPGQSGSSLEASPGDEKSSKNDGKTSSKPRVYPQRTMFCTGADDVVYCFDARTGATLWKTVYPGASANYGGSKGGPHLTPFVDAGKIYVLGSTERMYCLDAKTGKEIWQSSTGWSATAKYKILQECLATKKNFPVNRSLEVSLTVADGVVVCPDNRGKLFQSDGYGYTKGSGLIGLDAATGKRLWQSDEGTIGAATPTRWIHQGKTRIISEGNGAARCFEPTTGKVLWEIPCGPTGQSVVADEEHLLLNTGTDSKSGEVSCFQISPQKTEKMWSLPKKYQMPWGGYFYPVIHQGHAYFASTGEGSLVCVRLSDGKVLAEIENQGGGHTGGGASLIAGEGRTFSSGLCVTGLEENTKPLHAPWRIPFAIGYLTPIDPALADGRLFIRDKTGIACYDLRKR